MKNAALKAHAVPVSTHNGWRSFDHHFLNRRISSGRTYRRGRPQSERHVRDAIEISRSRTRGLRFLGQVAMVGLAALAVVDLFDDTAAIHAAALIGAVILAGAAALLAIAAAEPDGIYPLYARRWQLQAVASAVVMFMLMANRGDGGAGDLLWFLIVVGAASTLVAMATSYHDGGAGAGGIYLAFDSAIVGFTTALLIISVANSTPPVGGAAVLLGAFAAAGYAVAVAMRPAIRLDPRGSDALFLGGVLVLCLNAAGQSAQQIGYVAFAFLAAPGVALLGTLGLARSAWRAPRRPVSRQSEPPVATETRLSLLPAVAAAAAILTLSWLEVDGRATRAAFFGIVTLFGLVVGRLLLTLVVNRQLLQRVERSGLFEEKLRDLGGALVAALDRENTLELVCRTAQLALATDSVLLWMLDPATDELEAVEVLSAKRDSLLGRRFGLDEPTSLVARVARTGAPEIVSNVPSANASNRFLNVLLHVQALLAVPVVHRNRVQGVLVCVDARNPAAYGPRELGKAELLASQVAVALDNAYQHALQQQRLEELSALYQFAQSAHTAFSAPEIVRQLVPILRGRLNFAGCTMWLRDEPTGALRVAACDGAAAVTRFARPSHLAMCAFAEGEPQAGPSQLAVPMVIKRRVLGVVDLESRDGRAWSSTDERLLVALGNHAALAIDNLHLLDEARKVAALRELDRMKTELIGTVSHELRTPLGSIKGYATTLLTHGNRLRKDEQREFLEIIDSEADRLRDLIENLLDLSRLEAGVLRIDRQPVRLARCAHEVTRKVQLTATDHELALEWPQNDPLVDADEKRIYQVMQNLITNAVKYSPDGGCITLSAHARGRELIVAVSDEGLGIPAAEIDKIFDRFHRVQTETSRGIGGTGLGLAICKGLVEAHGGRIWAASGGNGLGSTFRFTLPLLAEVQDAPTVSATSSRSKGAHDHQEANRPGR